jgi:HK97 family phage portal protein
VGVIDTVRRGAEALVRAAPIPTLGAGGPWHVSHPVDWAGWPWHNAGWVPWWDGTAPGNERVAVVYSCVDRVASALSSMPLVETKDSMPQLPRQWMRNPNPQRYTHIGEAIDEVVWSLLLRGNAYLYVTARYADDGYPAEWVVLDPAQVQWEHDYQWWDDYRQVGGRGGYRIDFAEPEYQYRTGDARRDNLLHLRHRSKPGSPMGVSPLEAAFNNMASLEDMERLAGKLARHSGLPTQGLLTTDQDITEATAQRWKEKWQTRGDGDVAVLGAGLRYESLTLNPKDLAMLELREFDSRTIAGVFGVPPNMVGVAAADGLTYSTVQGNADGFWRNTLRPIASNIGRGLSRWLPAYHHVMFDADDYTQPQFADRMQAYATALGADIFDLDEIRAREQLPPRGTTRALSDRERVS